MISFHFFFWSLGGGFSPSLVGREKKGSQCWKVTPRASNSKTFFFSFNLILKLEHEHFAPDALLTLLLFLT
jgi:hypothetical protein